MPTLPTRKANYLIMVHLETGDPDVTRLLPLAPDMSFSEVHDAIQIAFNWADMHSYAFYVRLASHMGEMMDDLPSVSTAVSCGICAFCPLSSRVRWWADDTLRSSKAS